MAARIIRPGEEWRRFAALFDGLARAHGRYLVPRAQLADARGKVVGKPWTSKRPIAEADWRAHLTGEPVTVADGEGEVTGTLGLGVVPVRDDATAGFGAIDVDVYPLDLRSLLNDVEAMRLPLVVCRTKSGGAHLYLFTDGPVDAAVVRGRLMEFAVLLGHPGVEVFPKQVKLAGEDDDGSWINLPYAGGDRSTRYALDPATGEALTTAGFLSLAESRRMAETELAAFVPAPPAGADELDEWFGGGPPCLRILARTGFAEGSRNNALFDVGVYLKKRHGDDFEGHLDRYNARFMDPPLPSKDVQAVAKSLKKKEYSYKCRDLPISQVCNRTVCLTCEFGVGGQSDDPGVVLGELVKLKTDPPTWLWDVDGLRLELVTAQIMDQRAFHAAVVETLGKWPSLVKPGTWQTLVRERLARAESIEVPDDATKEGQLWEHLRRFCTGRVVAKTRDELLLGKPWTDEESGRTYFCSQDFMQYLQQQRFGGVGERDLYRWLRRKEVEHHFAVIKGKGLNHWSVPAFRAQTEDFDVPRRAVQGEM